MAEWKGIDVSKYQGVINWAQVREAGIQFAFVRLGVCGSDGSIRLDPTFERNIRGAADAGIETGVYLYSYAKTEQAARFAAGETIRLIAPYRVTYPVAFDFEDADYRAMTRTENTAIVRAYLEEVERQRYYAMLYTNTSFAMTELDMPSLRSFDFWVADWRTNVGYPGPYGIWQYTNSGEVDGISGRVDRDIAYQDYAEIIRKSGLNRPQDSERWQIVIYSFSQRERALEVADAFRILGLYSEVRPLGEAWEIVMYSFREESRAREISKAVTELGFYNEVRPLQV